MRNSRQSKIIWALALLFLAQPALARQQGAAQPGAQVTAEFRAVYPVTEAHEDDLL